MYIIYDKLNCMLEDKKKIVFILSSINIQRVVKRVNSFVDAGYPVEVYAFNRTGKTSYPMDFHVRYEIIGSFPYKSSYYKRFLIMRKRIKSLLSQFESSNVLLYLFGLDVALSIPSLYKRHYIYEEADLVHAYFPNVLVRHLFELKDLKIIRKSALTVLTSKGFVDYHFTGKKPKNVLVMGNKLSRNVLDIPKATKKGLSLNNLRIGFVGAFRFNTISHFCKVFLENFPKHEFHVYGVFGNADEEAMFSKYQNFKYHGPFKNPDDLPSIYANIDILLSTYDANTINARYAEPNKLYEAIFFDTPIIVSRNTYLEKRIMKDHIGFAIDAMNDNEIISFINTLTINDLLSCVRNIKGMDKSTAIYHPEALFERVQSIAGV